MEIFFYWFLVFMIYSFFGWVMETILVFYKNKKFVNRGFLIGPYCPVYGVAGLCMVWLLGSFENNIALLFVFSILISSIIEYITSYSMEKLFKARWWDYSKRKFNLNGRICLCNCLIFGLFGVLLISFVHPYVRSLILSLDDKYFYIISTFLVTIFLTDYVNTFKITLRLKKSFKNLKKDSTEEISKLVKDALINSSKMFDRLFLAFPNFKPLIKKERKRFPFFKK